MKKFKVLFLSLFIFCLFVLPAAAATTNDLQEQSMTISAIKKVIPSTVSIKITKITMATNETTGENYPVRVDVGQGTGIIVDSNGLILTNRHVGGDAENEYKVFLSDGRRFDAQVADVDKLYDLALLKIEAKKLPVAVIGDSDRLVLGQTVMTIGNALGQYQNSVARGVVSGMGRSIEASDSMGAVEQLDDVIQTDAAINLGNSGGPLIDLWARVVGINTAIEAGSQNVGFAIPVNAAKKMIETYKKYGMIRRPFLGVRYMMITPDLKEEQNLSLDEGAWITYGKTENDLPVIEGSPAEKAGLGAGDIITEVNAIKINSSNALLKIIQRYNIGDRIGLKIWRSGRIIMRIVTLDELK